MYASVLKDHLLPKGVYGRRRIEDYPNQIPLKLNGADIVVTDKNKEEYVTLSSEYVTMKGTEKQLEHFLTGFHELIPKNWVGVFTPVELELLIAGFPILEVILKT